MVIKKFKLAKNHYKKLVRASIALEATAIISIIFDIKNKSNQLIPFFKKVAPFLPGNDAQFIHAISAMALSSIIIFLVLLSLLSLPLKIIYPGKFSYIYTVSNSLIYFFITLLVFYENFPKINSFWFLFLSGIFLLLSIALIKDFKKVSKIWAP